MDNLLITGSLAYDHVCSFNGRFSEVIAPEKISTLSLSFLIDNKQTHFGGCAGNIAYNLKLLEENPIIFAVVGNDFKKYRTWMCKNHIIDKEIICVKNQETASATILTDLSGNQITLFYPGASIELPHILLENYKNRKPFAIISPDNINRMIHLAEECRRLAIPYLFDPGQQTHLFEKNQLISTIISAYGICVNEYEYHLLCQKAELKDSDILKHVEFLIVTLAEKGSIIYSKAKTYKIPSVRPLNFIDPTGSGDAYRAGILKGIKENYPWEKIGHMSSLIATYSIESNGSQNHKFTMDELKIRYEKEFNQKF